MQHHTFQHGQVIFEQGQPSDRAFRVVSGRIHIVLNSKNGAIKPISQITEGQYFGEMGLVDDKPRSATALSEGTTECVSVDRDEFMSTLMNDPQEAMGLLKVLFERLRDTNDRLSRVENIPLP